MFEGTTNNAASRIDVPTKGDLRLPTPAAIPRHAGHNWEDAAYRANHNRVQVLQAEATGKSYGLVATGAAARANELPSVTTGAAARLHGSIQNRVAECKLPGGTSASSFSAGGNGSASRSVGGSFGDLEKQAQQALLSTNRYDLAGRKLTFRAWFTERVPESAIEKVRTRSVTVTYHLEDETVAVFEPVIPSSGMAGGYLLRRTKAPLTEADAARRAPLPSDLSRFNDLALISEKHVTILDLNVGRPVTLFGTEYHLHECDAYTRDLLTVLGVAVPADAAAREDTAFLAYRKKMTGGAATTLPSSARLDPMRSPKSARAKQFAANAGVVLRFYATWDEETAACERREHKFELHYFLEDDSVSLRERDSSATGGEAIARHFLKRIRLPRSGAAAEIVDPMMANKGERNGVQYYGPADLFVGAKISAFKRVLVLVDADDATRKYYAATYGKTLAEPIIVSTVKPAPPPLVKVASTALALLTQEPPRGKSTLILKYELALARPETADDGLRRFVLTWFGESNEIAIGELVQRNSGFGGGRVLKRSVLMLPDGSRAVGVDDLVVGRKLQVYGREFVINALSARADAFANNADLERDDAAAEGVPKERVVQLVKTFRDHVMGRYVTLAEAFRVFDQDSDGTLTEFELRMFLAKHAISRSEAEAAALIAAFDRDGNGEISFKDFVQGCTYGVTGVHGLTPAEAQQQVVLCRARAQSQVLGVAHKVLLDKLRAKLDARHLNVFEMFRHMSTMPRKWPQVMPVAEYARNGARVTLNALTNAEKDCVVTPVQFRRVLVERVGMNVSPSEMAVLLSCFYPDLPESEYSSAEDVDALPPRALTLEDMHRVLCSNLRT